MSIFTELIKENTVVFYSQKEQEEQEQNDIYKDLFEKSKGAIIQNIEMFNELGAIYELTNVKGQALLKTEVFLFAEEGSPKLILTLRADCVTENSKAKVYSSYSISAGVDNVLKQDLFTDEVALSIDYSNQILELLQKRPLGEFLNNFGVLYSQEKRK